MEKYYAVYCPAFEETSTLICDPYDLAYDTTEVVVQTSESRQDEYLPMLSPSSESTLPAAELCIDVEYTTNLLSDSASGSISNSSSAHELAHHVSSEEDVDLDSNDDGQSVGTGSDYSGTITASECELYIHDAPDETLATTLSMDGASSSLGFATHIEEEGSSPKPTLKRQTKNLQTSHRIVRRLESEAESLTMFLEERLQEAEQNQAILTATISNETGADAEEKTARKATNSIIVRGILLENEELRCQVEVVKEIYDELWEARLDDYEMFFEQNDRLKKKIASLEAERLRVQSASNTPHDTYTSSE